MKDNEHEMGLSVFDSGAFGVAFGEFESRHHALCI